MTRAGEIAKRIFDVAAAGVLVCLLGPALLGLYLLVRLTSPGRGLFVQDRSGKANRPFAMLKFRTMRTGHAHDPDPSVVITPEHESVTPVGRFLRKYKLDELPQLLNVLAGQMSLVGPRPTLPEQTARYDDFQRRRLQVTPGITGLAQIHGDTALTWDERIEWDVYYVGHRSLCMDLNILARTALVLVVGPHRRVRRLGEVHPAEAGRQKARAPETPEETAD